MSQTFEDILREVLEATEKGMNPQEICEAQGVSQQGRKNAAEACEVIDNITAKEQELLAAKAEGVSTAEWLADQIHQTLKKHGVSDEDCELAEDAMEKAQIEAVENILKDQEG